MSTTLRLAAVEVDRGLTGFHRGQQLHQMTHVLHSCAIDSLDDFSFEIIVRHVDAVRKDVSQDARLLCQVCELNGRRDGSNGVVYFVSPRPDCDTLQRHPGLHTRSTNSQSKQQGKRVA